MKIGRNDACPCGSGKKFKHCHLGKEAELAEILGLTQEMDDGEGMHAPVDKRVPMALGGLGLILAILAGVAKGVGAAVVVAVSFALFIGGYLILRDPPKGDPNRPDSGSINFGG